MSEDRERAQRLYDDAPRFHGFPDISIEAIAAEFANIRAERDEELVAAAREFWEATKFMEYFPASEAAAEEDRILHERHQKLGRALAALVEGVGK